MDISPNFGALLFAVGLLIAGVLAYFFDRTRRMTETHRNVLGATIASLIMFASQVLPTLLFGKPTMGELIEYFLFYFGLSLLLLHHLAYIYGGEKTRSWGRSKAGV